LLLFLIDTLIVLPPEQEPSTTVFINGAPHSGKSTVLRSFRYHYGYIPPESVFDEAPGPKEKEFEHFHYILEPRSETRIMYVFFIYFCLFFLFITSRELCKQGTKCLLVYASEQDKKVKKKCKDHLIALSKAQKDPDLKKVILDAFRDPDLKVSIQYILIYAYIYLLEVVCSRRF